MQTASHFGALRTSRPNRQTGSNQFRPIQHDLQTHSFVGFNFSGETRTVVNDSQNTASVRAFQANDDVLGVAVFDGVANRLLRDAVQMNDGVSIVEKYR